MIDKIHFILRRQTVQIKEGGFPVLARKVRRLIFIIFAVPIVIILRMLQPFVVIRLCRLDVGRLGAMYPADWYLRERHASMDHKRTFDLFYIVQSFNVICNRQWLKMWKRILHIFPFGKLADVVYQLNISIPGGKPHLISYPLSGIWESERNEALKNILICKQPFLAFTPREEYLGQKALRDLGIPESTPFICFNARDSAYLESIVPEKDFSYHDFRNANIQNYIAAAEESVRRSYYAIRMGSVVKEKLNTTNPAIIDYATNGKRTDFLDIYLGAKCQFFICPDSGISIIPEVFRRPVVYANWNSIISISAWVHNGLLIFKKYYLKKENRFLLFREILNLGYPGEVKNLVKWGVELIENTPEEIRAVTIEMDERLNGTWQTTEEDEELQQRFWALFGPDKLRSPDLCIGAEYLRENKDLLA